MKKNSQLSRSIKLILCLGIMMLPLACSKEQDAKRLTLPASSNKIPPPPSVPGGIPNVEQAEEALALDGRALYAQYCENCHSPLANSTRLGTSLLAIETAIAEEPAMSGLKDLDPAEVEAIARVLAIPVAEEEEAIKGNGKANGKAKGKKEEAANKAPNAADSTGDDEAA